MRHALATLQLLLTITNYERRINDTENAGTFGSSTSFYDTTEL